MGFLFFYFMPFSMEGALGSGIELLNEYARLHVLTCLVPALFIAGAIGVFVEKKRLIKYLGPKTNKYVSYLVASVSGVALAVCSCTILPLFAGIRKNGAGLGPAIAFLFSGPAINIAAIFLTFSVLGTEIGVARVFSSVVLAVFVGVSMDVIFKEKQKGVFDFGGKGKSKFSKKFLGLFFVLLVGMLIVNGLEISGKYFLIVGMFLISVGISFFKFGKKSTESWMKETWRFAKLILPLLFVGVFVAGVIMPLIPEELITNLVGENTIFGNLIAAIFGAFMYFSTLTEIPILQALIGKGMAKGPVLALLLAGPSLSLPNMFVIRGVLGTKKTAVYIGLVVVYSTMAGFLFGLV